VKAVKRRKSNTFRKKKTRESIFIACVSWPYGNEAKRMLIAPVPVQGCVSFSKLKTRPIDEIELIDRDHYPWSSSFGRSGDSFAHKLHWSHSKPTHDDGKPWRGEVPVNLS
jgi:hypothetical protein